MSVTEPARPRPRPFWADARFLLGLTLIVASVAGVWLVVLAARQSEPVFAAARTIIPGEEVTAADLRVVDVGLGGVSETYAAPVDLEPGTVAVRTVEAGELVPRSALGAPESATRTTVVMRTNTDVPAAVRPGSDVEVWVAPAPERGADADDEAHAPRILVPSATVASVTRDEGVVAGTSVSLELVIARADVPAALAAIAAGATVSVVPGTGR